MDKQSFRGEELMAGKMLLGVSRQTLYQWKKLEGAPEARASRLVVVGIQSEPAAAFDDVCEPPPQRRNLPAIGAILDNQGKQRQISFMQTTLRIDDEIYRRAKSKSSELGLSLTRFFEEAVEDRLNRLEARPTKRIVLPVSPVSGPPMSEEELRRRVEAADLEYDLSKLK